MVAKNHTVALIAGSFAVLVNLPNIWEISASGTVIAPTYL